MPQTRGRVRLAVAAEEHDPRRLVEPTGLGEERRGPTELALQLRRARFPHHAPRRELPSQDTHR
jgi:hypothetical protein